MNKHAKMKAPTVVSVAEAKAHFSEFLARAAAGEEIHITKHGKPYVTIAAESKKKPKRRFGVFKDTKLWMSDDFDELGPEWDEYTK